VVFPFLQSVVTSDASGTVADDATIAAGATVTVIDSATNQVRIQVPNLGIDVTGAANRRWGQSANGLWFDSLRHISQYAMYGTWQVSTGFVGRQSSGAFVLGYVTTQSAVPTSGKAVYAAIGNVWGLAMGPIDTSRGPVPSGAVLWGDASLTVDFTDHSVTGSLTKMRMFPDYDFVDAVGGTVWNNVAITGTQSGSQLTGTTSVTSTPVTGWVLPGTATGFFNGELFGPTGEELGAVWTLSDGTRSAMGTILAPRQ
jgi:hypothetical protein